MSEQVKDIVDVLPEHAVANVTDAVQPTRKPSRTVYFTMVHSPYGVKRVGNAYPTREAAQGWTSFVSGAWRGCRASVRKCAISYDDQGNIDAKTKERLDKEFNLDC